MYATPIIIDKSDYLSYFVVTEKRITVVKPEIFIFTVKSQGGNSKFN